MTAGRIILLGSAILSAVVGQTLLAFRPSAVGATNQGNSRSNARLAQMLLNRAPYSHRSKYKQDGRKTIPIMATLSTTNSSLPNLARRKLSRTEVRMSNAVTEANGFEGAINVVQNLANHVWYTLFHAWRTWYFTSLFMLTYMSASRFSPGVVIGLLAGHPAFYITFFAIAKNVFDADWKAIENGRYKMPYDADLWSILQWMRPDRIIAYMQDAQAIADRAMRGGSNELPATYRMPPSGSYPEYYLRNFHYQTDGWLSDASAAVYEVSTEALFSGTQDAMQRMGLAPITNWLATRTDTTPVEVLDAGCGTGRFLCQMAHNFDGFRFTALDLSPYYLDACKRSYSDLQASSEVLPAEFVHANMEHLPFPDASKDVVVCAYVFHELPPSARQAAAQEFFRVLRPGGLMVLLDSAQRGDLGYEMEGALEWFPRTFHEPYFKSWLGLDLGQLFGQLGFQKVAYGTRHVSKMVAWLKPSKSAQRLFF